MSIALTNGLGLFGTSENSFYRFFAKYDGGNTRGGDSNSHRAGGEARRQQAEEQGDQNGDGKLDMYQDMGSKGGRGKQGSSKGSQQGVEDEIDEAA